MPRRCNGGAERSIYMTVKIKNFILLCSQNQKGIKKYVKYDIQAREFRLPKKSKNVKINLKN